MPASANDPYPGYVQVRRNEALGDFREWVITASTVNTVDHEPGATIVLTYTTSTSGATAVGQATSIEVQARLPGEATPIGTTWTIASPGTSGQTRTMHLDDDPLGGTLGSPRSAMIELHMRVIRTTAIAYDVDSRGAGMDANDEWTRGFFRVPFRVASSSVSNVGFAGAEPAPFAYPDPIYLRATLQAQAWGADSHTLALRQAGVAISSEAKTTTGPNLDFDQDAAADRIDNEYAAGPVTPRITLDSDVMSGNAGSYFEYQWAAAGHAAGWTRPSTRELEYVDRFDVDPTVTIANPTLALPATTVYNRGEVASGTFEVRNARNEAITPVTADSVRLRRVTGGALEDTATVSRAGGVVSWSFTFATSGNVAPADVTGDDKVLEWRDTSAAITLAYPTSPVGLLSSLLDVTSHMQLNDNVLDPLLDTDNRLTSDLGFYSLRVTNRRGEGKNGVTVTDHLQDDASLVAVTDRTASTATVNGNVGYLPLLAWPASLPGGGWDHWTDAGTYQGNTFQQARKGVGASDFTLLSLDPNIIVVAGGGHNTIGEDALHWHAGADLLVGATLFHGALNATIPVDDSDVLDPGGQPYPKAYVSIARFNLATGTAEYFDSDMTWKSAEANPGDIHQWQLISILRANQLQGFGSVGDQNTYVVTIPGANTADWGASELYFIPFLFKNSTPYSVFGLTGVLGTANNHGGYAVDPIALALHGVLGTR